MLSIKQEEEEEEQEENPMTIFMYTLKAPDTRRQYPQRFKMFLDYLKLEGALEDLPMEEIKRQNETNFYDVIRVSQNVLPIMRSQRDGIIINISSVSGLAGIPSQSVYVSTKFALEGLSESLSLK